MNKYILLGVAIISGLIGWFSCGVVADRDIASLQASHAETLKAISDKAIDEQQKLQDELEAKQQRWSQIEKSQYEKLRHAQTENSRLRSDIDAGRKRLLIHATCPASSNNLPEAAASTSVDIGASAELDPALRQDYYALRNGIEQVTRQLKACQAMIIDEIGAAQ